MKERKILVIIRNEQQGHFVREQVTVYSESLTCNMKECRKVKKPRVSITAEPGSSEIYFYSHGVDF